MARNRPPPSLPSCSAPSDAALGLAITVASPDPPAVRFEVRAKPRASKSRVVGVRDGALEMSVAAAPVDGEANRELVETLSSALGVPRRDVSIVRGESSRVKLVEARGLSPDEVRARLLREP